jgi:hypothetical protein
MTHYTLSNAATQETYEVRGRDPAGDDVVALPCPWHSDTALSCICDLTYGRFWCAACERQGPCLVQTPWETCEEAGT